MADSPYLDEEGNELRVGDTVVLCVYDYVDAGQIIALRQDGDSALATVQLELPEDYDPDRVESMKTEDGDEFTFTMAEAYQPFEVECCELLKADDDDGGEPVLAGVEEHG